MINLYRKLKCYFWPDEKYGDLLKYYSKREARQILGDLDSFTNREERKLKNDPSTTKD